MRVIEPGHHYSFDEYDTSLVHLEQQLRFMKRVGDKYPGNEIAHAGTNCQEVTRALIDRVKHLQQQDHSDYNTAILAHYHMALLLFEQRAAERHGLALRGMPIHNIESIKTCHVCGHVVCLCAEVK